MFFQEASVVIHPVHHVVCVFFSLSYVLIYLFLFLFPFFFNRWTHRRKHFNFSIKNYYFRCESLLGMKLLASRPALSCVPHHHLMCIIRCLIQSVYFSAWYSDIGWTYYSKHLLFSSNKQFMVAM